MKCRNCGCDFDIDEARSTFNYFYEGTENYDSYYSPSDRMCGTCAINDFHIQSTGEEADFENVW